MHVGAILDWMGYHFVSFLRGLFTSFVSLVETCVLCPMIWPSCGGGGYIQIFAYQIRVAILFSANFLEIVYDSYIQIEYCICKDIFNVSPFHRKRFNIL